MSTFEEKNQYQVPKKQSFSQKNKDFWFKYGEKVILLIGIFIIALISFEAGFLKGQKNKLEPITLNQAACAPCPKSREFANEGGSKANAVTKTAKTTAPTTASENGKMSITENQECIFIASKNSDKYHLATCQFAQKIKPENRVCFSSAEEASNRGYQGAKCCIK